jgi:UDP-N-acetylmuramoyl-tripeptide--D-alanyl-D-alanine ligase
MNVYEKKGFTVIADCYNAAPESVRGAINTLSSLPVEGRRVAVLGDMKELGKDSDALHRSIGEYLSGKIDMLFTLGESGALIADAAISAGMSYDNVVSVKDTNDKSGLCEIIKSRISKGDAVLFKASRSVKLEEVISLVFDNEN